MIQEKAFGIILGSKFKNYTNALEILEQETLSARRLKLCEHFAIKCVNNPKHADLFPMHTGPKTRHTKTYIEPKCNTTRYYKSAVPFLTRLLNTI